MAERWYARLERLLEHQLRGRQPLVLYASHVDFEQTNVIAGELGEGTGGVTESFRRRIVLPLAGPLADTDHVLGHELVHAFQFDITMRPGSAPGETGVQMLPLWFVEGMAEYLSIGPVDTNTAMWLRDAARTQNDKDRLPTIDDLNEPQVLPVPLGSRVLGVRRREVGRRHDRRDAPNRRRHRRYRNRHAAGARPQHARSCRRNGRTAIRRAFGSGRGRTNEVGRVILTGKGLGEELNVGPSISPDGKLDRVPLRPQLLLDRLSSSPKRPPAKSSAS